MERVRRETSVVQMVWDACDCAALIPFSLSRIACPGERIQSRFSLLRAILLIY